MWLFVHIAFLTGYRNRATALLTWGVAFTRDIRRERAYTTREVGHLRDVYAPTPAEVQAARGGQPPQQRAASDTPSPSKPATLSRRRYPAVRAGMREEDACPPTRS